MTAALPAGPDPRFPFLSEHERFRFPDPERSRGGIVALGGNLSPGMLLSAYEQGIFPWYNDGEPLIWQSPDPRFVLFSGELHVSSSMEKTLRQRRFEVRFDSDFPAVIRACAQTPRDGQRGTWITADMIDAYLELRRLGYAHSGESYCGGRLAGGFYGIRLGKMFFGESMFAWRSNASKAAFISFARRFFDEGGAFIDCQVHTEHLASLGARTIPRSDFLALLREPAAAGSAPLPNAGRA